MKSKIADLFSGAGGAAMGLHRAGFEVVGFDIKPQKNYPFEFHQMDAFDVDLDEFDAVWASPPCQGYSLGVRNEQTKETTPKLIGSVRQLVQGKPHIIENVMGAKSELQATVFLCGRMFGLPIRRHRLFEMNFPCLAPGHPKCVVPLKGLRNRALSITGHSRYAGCVDDWKQWMEMPWVTYAHELTQAIPPVYSRFLGERLIAHLRIK